MALTVEFEVDPSQMEMFLPLITDNARRSLAEESGCRLFDVCLDRLRPSVVLLYEVYDDEAAFEAHQGSEHFATFTVRSEGMVLRKTVRFLQKVYP